MQVERSGKTHRYPTRRLAGECTNGRIKDMLARIGALGALHILESPEELVFQKATTCLARQEAANRTVSH